MTTTAAPKIKGITINLGGADYVVPPLSLGAFEAQHDRFSALSGGITEGPQLTIIIDAAHAALRRNYPAMTREEVADAIGLDNMTEVLEAVMDVGGARRKAAQAAAPAAAET